MKISKGIYYPELIGKIFTSVIGCNKDSEEIVFLTKDNKSYTMWHSQDCCEIVFLDDVEGDIEDIKNSPIIMFEEICNEDIPPIDDYIPESYTWTFYKIGTNKGSITIRWYGESNGCYSESVDIRETENPEWETLDQKEIE